MPLPSQPLEPETHPGELEYDVPVLSFGLACAHAAERAPTWKERPERESLTTVTGILLDTETTGLEPRKDEVIELGMVKFDYCPTAASSASGTSSLNEPSVPIPPEVTSLTGITDEMVAGQRFEEAPVSAFVEDAVIGPRCRS